MSSVPSKRGRAEAEEDWGAHADEVIANNVKVPFASKDPEYQKKIQRQMRQQLFDTFSDNSMHNTVDCLAFLKSCEAQLGVPAAGQDREEVMSTQLKTLSLPNRNRMISLLTHNSGKINTDMLEIFPGLEARSRELLQQSDRKERCDKIDLMFVSDFMHDYCRYFLCAAYVLSLTRFSYIYLYLFRGVNIE
jgi:hypothetical protein